MIYTVPDYYQNFSCKCDKCKRSCCDGWPVRISIKEYYRLLGVECSDQLRNRIDCALKVCSNPSNEYYAQISSDWKGFCMLHLESGLCALQSELGEISLPDVCRLYPRVTRQVNEASLCSCAGSCERVIELLMDRKEPLTFEEKELFIQPEFVIQLPSKLYEYTQTSITIIQDRSLSLPDRFIELGNYVNPSHNISKATDIYSVAFPIVHYLNEYYKDSINFCDYCSEIQDYYGIKDKEVLSGEDLETIAGKYTSASAHLEAILPDWQIKLEQLLVNHMIYNNFPYAGMSINHAFLSLVTMYSFLRFNMAGFLYHKNDTGILIDFLAAIFRVIEHSNFTTMTVNLIKNGHSPEQEGVLYLL